MEHGDKFSGSVRELKIDDLDQLRPILERWIRTTVDGEVIKEEVEEDLQTMRDSLEGRLDATFFVAVRQSDNSVAGVGGVLRAPRPAVKQFMVTERPVELINMYMSDREGGIGSAVLAKAEDFAKKHGYTEMGLDSGPRYEKTAWGFYDKKGFTRVGIAKDRYGEGGDAPVWEKIL